MSETNSIKDISIIKKLNLIEEFITSSNAISVRDLENINSLFNNFHKIYNFETIRDIYQELSEDNTKINYEAINQKLDKILESLKNELFKNTEQQTMGKLNTYNYSHNQKLFTKLTKLSNRYTNTYNKLYLNYEKKIKTLLTNNLNGYPTIPDFNELIDFFNDKITKINNFLEKYNKINISGLDFSKYMELDKYKLIITDLKYEYEIKNYLFFFEAIKHIYINFTTGEHTNKENFIGEKNLNKKILFILLSIFLNTPKIQGAYEKKNEENNAIKEKNIVLNSPLNNYYTKYKTKNDNIITIINYDIIKNISDSDINDEIKRIYYIIISSYLDKLKNYKDYKYINNSIYFYEDDNKTKENYYIFLVNLINIIILIKDDFEKLIINIDYEKKENSKKEIIEYIKNKYDNDIITTLSRSNEEIKQNIKKIIFENKNIYELFIDYQNYTKEIKKEKLQFEKKIELITSYNIQDNIDMNKLILYILLNILSNSDIFINNIILYLKKNAEINNVTIDETKINKIKDQIRKKELIKPFIVFNSIKKTKAAKSTKIKTLIKYTEEEYNNVIEKFTGKKLDIEKLKIYYNLPKQKLESDEQKTNTSVKQKRSAFMEKKEEKKITIPRTTNKMKDFNEQLTEQNIDSNYIKHFETYFDFSEGKIENEDCKSKGLEERVKCDLLNKFLYSTYKFNKLNSKNIFDKDFDKDFNIFLYNFIKQNIKTQQEKIKIVVENISNNKEIKENVNILYNKYINRILNLILEFSSKDKKNYTGVLNENWNVFSSSIKVKGEDIDIQLYESIVIEESLKYISTFKSESIDTINENIKSNQQKTAHINIVELEKKKQEIINFIHKINKLIKQEELTEEKKNMNIITTKIESFNQKGKGLDNFISSNTTYATSTIKINDNLYKLYPIVESYKYKLSLLFNKINNIIKFSVRLYIFELMISKLFEISNKNKEQYNNKFLSKKELLDFKLTIENNKIKQYMYVNQYFLIIINKLIDNLNTQSRVININDTNSIYIYMLYNYNNYLLSTK